MCKTLSASFLCKVLDGKGLYLALLGSPAPSIHFLIIFFLGTQWYAEAIAGRPIYEQKVCLETKDKKRLRNLD